MLENGLVVSNDGSGKPKRNVRNKSHRKKKAAAKVVIATVVVPQAEG